MYKRRFQRKHINPFGRRRRRVFYFSLVYNIIRILEKRDDRGRSRPSHRQILFFTHTRICRLCESIKRMRGSIVFIALRLCIVVSYIHKIWAAAGNEASVYYIKCLSISDFCERSRKIYILYDIPNSVI